MRCSLASLVVYVALSGIADLARTEDRDATAPQKQAIRIGVYDSRVVACAHLWTDAVQNRIEAMQAEAEAAEEHGDQKKLDELRKIMAQHHRKVHHQVLSTAPIDDVLQEIKDRLPAIQAKAGVSLLVSKWNEAKLKQYTSAKQVDVTDLLVNEFKPTPRDQKIFERIKKMKPLSLDEADKIF